MIIYRTVIVKYLLSRIHTQNIGYERVLHHILKIFLVLNPFLPDPYQS